MKFPDIAGKIKHILFDSVEVDDDDDEEASEKMHEIADPDLSAASDPSEEPEAPSEPAEEGRQEKAEEPSASSEPAKGDRQEKAEEVPVLPEAAEGDRQEEAEEPPVLPEAAERKRQEKAAKPGRRRKKQEKDPQDPKKKKKHPIRTPLLLTLLGFFLVGLLVALIFVAVQIAKAPDISADDISPEGYRTVILDKNGEQIDVLSKTESNRVYVTLNEDTDYLEEAFVAIEDSRFYRHNGIDPRGILRALVRGILKGNFSEGASTITQQLIKNNVLTSWTSENTFMDRLSRKIQEQYLAMKLEKNLEKTMSKEEAKTVILENYMNTINLGGGTRGVQVAAQYYFGKDADQLSLAQCALIAGITKNPTGYNPFNYPDASLNRQKLVLAAMKKQGMIDSTTYNQALKEDVIGELVTDHENTAQIFSWYEDALLTSIVNDLVETYGYYKEAAWDELYSGGLTIYSAEDPDIQKICEYAAQNDAYKLADEEVSIVITDVSTGAVVATVGGREEKTASLISNRASDAIRQPGSTLKVIGEYAAALEAGEITLGSVYDDAPYNYTNGTAVRNANGKYGGMTTVQNAISSSDNIVALKVFQQVGQEAVIESLEKFGITTLNQNDYNESLALGGTYNGVTNLELTGAYNALANGGLYIEPHYYTKVVDRQGNVILEYTKEGTQAVSKETAELLTLAMEDTMTDGTGKAAKPNGFETAGKSGTTTDNRDVWFVGYSKYYTCGIWGGYDDNSEQAGSQYVKQLWNNIMTQAHKDITGAENAVLVDTSDLESATICTKCGKLAVTGLCDDTVQGNMTEKEYYKEGTAPTEQCDCHVEVVFCSKSGKPAGDNCPYSVRISRVYLKTATEGTTDADYTAESLENLTCDVHTNWTDRFKIWETGDDSSSDDGTTDSGENSSGTGSGTSGESGSSNSGSSSGNSGDSGSGESTDSGSSQGIMGFIKSLFQ